MNSQENADEYGASIRNDSYYPNGWALSAMAIDTWNWGLTDEYLEGCSSWFTGTYDLKIQLYLQICWRNSVY